MVKYAIFLVNFYENSWIFSYRNFERETKSGSELKILMLMD